MIRVFNNNIRLGIKLPKFEFRTSVFLLEILIFVLFSIVYPSIVEQYVYKGMSYDFSLIRFVISTFIYLLFIGLGYYIKHIFDYVIWHIYLIYMLVPTLINYYTSDNDFQLTFITLIFLIVLIFTHKFNLKTRFEKLSIKLSRNYYLLILITVILFIPFIYYYIGHINVLNLFFIDVYQTRMKFREISLVPLNYIINVLVKVLLPILIVSSLQKRKKGLIVLFIIMIFYLYLCGAFKSYFAGALAVFIFYFGNLQTKLKIFISGILIITFFGWLFDDMFILLDLGIRRVFFTPVGLGNIYLDFFEHNYLYWSHTELGSIFLDYPFDRGLTGYVGSVVMGEEGLNANIGVIIEGFVSAGYLGVVIHSLLIGVLFNFFKNLNISSRYFGVIIIVIFNTMNSLIQLLLITHSLFVFIIIALLFLKDSKELDN